VTDILDKLKVAALEAGEPLLLADAIAEIEQLRAGRLTLVGMVHHQAFLDAVKMVEEARDSCCGPDALIARLRRAAEGVKDV